MAAIQIGRKATLAASPYSNFVRFKGAGTGLAYSAALNLNIKDIARGKNDGHDIYLLLDCSESTNDPAGKDDTIFSTIKKAGYDMINGLPENHRAGVWFFNHEVHQVSPLAFCDSAHKRRVEKNLMLERQFNYDGNGATHIAPALSYANELIALEKQKMGKRKAIIILVSDGNQYPYDEYAVLEAPEVAAEKIRQNGVQIFTIGVGGGLDAAGQKMLYAVGDTNYYAYLENPIEIKKTLGFMKSMFAATDITDARLVFRPATSNGLKPNHVIPAHLELEEICNLYLDNKDTWIKGDLDTGTVELVGLASNTRYEAFIKLRYDKPSTANPDSTLLFGTVLLVAGSGQQEIVLAECELTMTIVTRHDGDVDFHVSALNALAAIKRGDVKMAMADNPQVQAEILAQQELLVSKTMNLAGGDSRVQAVAARHSAMKGTNDPAERARLAQSSTSALPNA